MKYVFNYLHKGEDMAYCNIKKDKDQVDEEIKDEIKNYLDGRYMGPTSAAWRLCKFPLCGRSHTVVRLAVHTENQQQIMYEENKESEAIENWKTTLTAWFELNKNYKEAHNIKYKNLPKYYVFKNKEWIKRINTQKHYAIGRLNMVSPKDSERFHLNINFKCC